MNSDCEPPDNFIEIQLNDDTGTAEVNQISELSLADSSGIEDAAKSATTKNKEEAKEPHVAESQGLDSAEKTDSSISNNAPNLELSTSVAQCMERTSPSLDKETEEVPEIKPAVLSIKELEGIDTHFVEAKEILNLSKVKALYPEIPEPVFDHTSAVATIKPLVPNERLYPELPLQPRPVPITREHLKIFEPCSWLENVDSFTEEFERIAHQDRHEFHELLMNYGRCRKQLLLAESKLQIMISDWKNIKSKVWDFKEEHMTVQVMSWELWEEIGLIHEES